MVLARLLRQRSVFVAFTRIIVRFFGVSRTSRYFDAVAHRTDLISKVFSSRHEPSVSAGKMRRWHNRGCDGWANKWIGSYNQINEVSVAGLSICWIVGVRSSFEGSLVRRSEYLRIPRLPFLYSAQPSSNNQIGPRNPIRWQ